MLGNWTTEIIVGAKICIWNGVYKGDATLYELILYALTDALKRVGVNEDVTILVNDESVARTANWILNDYGHEIDKEEVELLDAHRCDWNALFKELGGFHADFQSSDRRLNNELVWQDNEKIPPAIAKRRRK